MVDEVERFAFLQVLDTLQLKKASVPIKRVHRTISHRRSSITMETAGVIDTTMEENLRRTDTNGIVEPSSEAGKYLERGLDVTWAEMERGLHT